MTVASIRFKNPGAMWGHAGKRTSPAANTATTNPIAVRWHSTQTIYLNDGLGQGNNIAVFDNFVDGICAQIDLWRSPRYKNKRFADAIHTWDGGNNTPSYIAYVKARVPGMNENTIMSDAFFNSPSGILFFKAQAGHEAGQIYPALEADWSEAQRRVFAGPPTPIANNPQPKKAAAAVATVVVATSVATTQIAVHNTGTHWGIIVLLAGLALAGVAAWWFHFRHKDQ